MKLERNRLARVGNDEIENGTFEIPSNISVINETAFKNCSNLKNIVIPNSVSSIGAGVFFNCSNLEEVKLSKNIKIINNETFKNCTNLKHIKIPKSVSKIKFSAFEGCSSLESIKIPSGIKIIDDSTFLNCTSVKKVSLPFTLKRITHQAFAGCSSLKNINIPFGVTDFYEGSFKNCTSLKAIKIPHNTKSINRKSFYGCSSLTKVTLPKNLRNLGQKSFKNCSSLTSVNIPKNIRTLEEGTFENCSSLKNVKFSGGELTYINLRVFANCLVLTDIKLPRGLKIIGAEAFDGCSNLKNIKLPSSLKILFEYSFKNCSSIEKITLPDSLDVIKHNAFEGCTSLKKINIPEKVTTIQRDIFEGCNNLEEVSFPASATKVEKMGNCSLKFFTKDSETGGFTLSSYANNDSIPLDEINVNLGFLSKHWEHKDTILKEQKHPNICDFYNTFLTDRGAVLADSIIKSHNFTFLKKFDFTGVQDNKTPFYLFLYNMGALSKPMQIGDKTYDYSQKVSEFLLERINKNKISINQICDSFRYMNLNGFKKEFTDFFLANFDDLMVEEKKKRGFIAKCFNEFEEVQKTNTSNRGSQRQLKPTVQKFKDYFETSMFNNVTPENMEIARTISTYFTDQGTFNLAIGIDKIRKDENIPNNILNTPLKETLEDTKNLPFANIDKIARKIGKSATSTLDELITIANNEFSFEWLEKNDPNNFILGKLCSCCAHLEGMGFGIMHASIVHPTIQNLVIRDGKGEIVAKSTLYLNKEKGYGVFNNVEVSADILLDKKQKIYEKYILGVKRFIEEYNKENPNNELMQVNVGMSLNDLSHQIIRNHKYELKPNLPAINYAEYGMGALNHSGDSDEEQCIIWKSDKLKEKPKQPQIINTNQNNQEKQ